MTAASEPAQIDLLLESLAAEFAVGAEVAEARADYEARRGRIFEDEALWESWSAAFVDWFLVERPLRAQARPPAGVALARGDAANQSLLRALLTSHRSVFEVTRLDAGEVGLVDLVGGAEFDVAEPRALHGVEVGDIAELRLVGYADKVRFGRTFVYHPRAAAKAIRDLVDDARRRATGRLEIADQLAALRVRLERYRHVAPAKVYAATR